MYTVNKAICLPSHAERLEIDTVGQNTTNDFDDGEDRFRIAANKMLPLGTW